VKHSFPYGWAEPLDLGGCDLNGIYAPAALDRSRDTDSRNRGPSLAEALERPMGKPGLKDLVRQKTVSGVPRVLVIADDMTRNTPIKLLLPKVMEEIRAGGVPRENIRILIDRSRFLIPDRAAGRHSSR